MKMGGFKVFLRVNGQLDIKNINSEQERSLCYVRVVEVASAYSIKPPVL